jgi:hypothetical protein
MHAAKRTLFDLDARVGTQSAATHGRTAESPVEGDSLEESRGRLAGRYAARIEDHAQLAKEYRAISRATDEVDAERTVRVSLDSRALAAEDRARQSVVGMAGGISMAQVADGLQR